MILKQVNIIVEKGAASVTGKCDVISTGNTAELAIVSFNGAYKHGSLGRSDAEYMSAFMDKAVSDYNPVKLILNLYELEYTWGNNIEDVIFPMYECLYYVVTGPKCDEGLNSLGMSHDTGFRFKNLDSALKHIGINSIGY